MNNKDTGNTEAKTSSAEEYKEPLTLQDGENEIASDKDMRLTIQKNSLAVSVYDGRTGKTWKTNPDEPEKDKIAKGEAIDLLRSQFQIFYYDKNGNLKTMNSYHDSVSLNQTKIYKIDNGVAIRYLVGDTKKGESDIPSKISNSRFTEVILSKLDQNDAAEMKSFYKHYQDGDMWSIKPKGRNNTARVLELLDKAGYTAEDLAVDNAQFGISDILSKKATFEIVLEYRLEGNALHVEIPTNRLVYSNDFPLYQIKLLENFLSAKEGSDGYLMLPDGSGSLIRFNQSVDSRDAVSIPLYGADAAIKSENTTMSSQMACLPVYGIRENDSAILGIVDSGEANASIEAYRARRNNENYAVYPLFNVVNMDFIYLSGNDSLSTVPAFQKKIFDGNYSVKYLFLNGENANYIGMADAYRDELISTGKLKKLEKSETVPLVVDTIGGVTGYKDFLGVSYIGLEAATTYGQNIEILKTLADQGITDVNLKLSGWFNGGISHDYPSKVKTDNVLGGKKELQKLIDYAKSNGAGLYPDVDLLTVYSSGNGFWPVFDAARYLDATEAKVSDISLATKLEREKNGLKNPYRYILSAGKITGLVNEFLKSYSKYQFSGISLRTMGSELYSDYDSRDTYSRSAAQDIITQNMKKISEKTGDMMIIAGHAYALPYAEQIINVPVDHSYFMLEDCSVPFYQAVLHGYVNLSGPSMNLADDTRQAVLRSIEYGVGLQYQLIYQPSSFMKNTEYDSLYRCNYQDLIPEIGENYKMVSQALGKVATSTITGHAQLADGVFKTTYDNGISVYVNYGKTEVQVEEVTVGAENVTVKEG